MFAIDSQGYVTHREIRRAIRRGIEREPMPVVQGIIVHQTDSPTVSSTLHSYESPKANGAHFLIDKDGTVYQTASLFRQTKHVGKIKSLCYEKRTCSPREMKEIAGFRMVKSPSRAASLESRHELPKPPLDRFPSNDNSIGIELVGMATSTGNKKDEEVYEPVTAAQNASLRWLVKQIEQSLKIPSHRIYRHPEVSKKTETEASTANWQ